MKIACALAAMVLGLWGLGAAAGETRYARPELLVEPSELAKPEASGKFAILDVRPEDEYIRGHVPKAHRVDHDAWKKAYAEDKTAKGWGKRIGELGIGRDSTVVVYDDKGMKDAARIWWILKYWGVKDVRLLNGGWKGWKDAGLRTPGWFEPSPTRVEFEAVSRPKRLATMEQILAWLPQEKMQIVDARSEDEFCGVNKKDNKKGGAIPGAKHLEWSDLIEQDTQRFKSADQLRGLFDEAGIDLDRPTASHCNGGGRAAVMAFGLELMGAKEVRNYYRGWGEWGNADDAPVMKSGEL